MPSSSPSPIPIGQKIETALGKLDKMELTRSGGEWFEEVSYDGVVQPAISRPL